MSYVNSQPRRRRPRPRQAGLSGFFDFRLCDLAPGGCAVQDALAPEVDLTAESRKLIKAAEEKERLRKMEAERGGVKVPPPLTPEQTGTSFTAGALKTYDDTRTKTIGIGVVLALGVGGYFLWKRSQMP